jgi:hypothetical protein
MWRLSKEKLCWWDVILRNKALGTKLKATQLKPKILKLLEQLLRLWDMMLKFSRVFRIFVLWKATLFSVSKGGSFAPNFSLYWSRWFCERKSIVTCNNIKSSVFWDIRSCGPVKVNRSFGWMYRLHLQDWGVSQIRKQHEAGSKHRVQHLRIQVKLSVLFCQSQSQSFQLTRAFYAFFETLNKFF